MKSRRVSHRMPLATVYVGVGSNIQPWREIRAGLRRLTQRFGPLAVSPVYRCRAVGFDGPAFINLVVGFASVMPPEKIAAELRSIEHRHQARRLISKKFSSRRLDLDLLLYANHCDATLQLPRSDIADYAYTLWPLADIAGASLHPKMHIFYRELRRRFGDDQRLRRLRFAWR